MNETREDPNDIFSRAAGWFVRIGSDEKWTKEEDEAFQQWLLDDPNHKEHQESLSKAFDFFRAASSRTSELRSSFRHPVARHRRPTPWIRLALAASALLAIGIIIWLARPVARQEGDTYATRTGETRTVRLADGTLVELDSRTRIEWTDTGSSRSVVLHEGQALFKVQHDVAHPFRVLAGPAEIEVLGTEFNVDSKSNGAVAIAVLNGQVEVRDRGDSPADSKWRRVLGPNERLIYRRNERLPEIATVETGSAARWRDGVLEINNEPLSEALEDLSRYTDRHLVANDPRLAQVRVGGILTTRDVRAALERLQETLPISVAENNGVFTLTYREPDKPSTAR